MRNDYKKCQRFRKVLLVWWDQNGISYPWRSYKDPFHILLAEILLRKTNAEKVKRLVPQVIAELPSPRAIFSYPLRKLERLLAPFGMQKKKSHELKQLVEVLGGRSSDEVPSTLEGLKRLPGVGDYIANAVLSVAYGERRPIVDTNVIRVISRVFDYTSTRSRPRTDPALWKYAEGLLPRRRVKEYNWALLDLAKRVCRPRRPKCQECPLRKICVYYASNAV